MLSPFTLITYLLLISVIANDISSFSIGTWNSFDLISATDRKARRDYTLTHTNEIFNQDILCVQEAFSPNAVNEFANGFKETYPYSYYENPTYNTPACSASMYDEFIHPSGLLYDCSRECADDLLSDTQTDFTYCIYKKCFKQLKKFPSGVTTRSEDPYLYDIGQELQLGECWTCIWELPYIENTLAYWKSNQYTGIQALSDLLTRCSSDENDLNYLANPGMIIFSKYELNEVEFVPLDSGMWIPRGAMVAKLNVNMRTSVTIMCLHLEPGTQDLTTTPMITFDDESNANGASTWTDILELQISKLIEYINKENNVIVTGDFNMGFGMSESEYNELISETDLKNTLQSEFKFNTPTIREKNKFCTKCGSNDYNNYPGFLNVIIDNILIKGNNIQSKNPQIFVNNKYSISIGDKKYLSDHYGNTAEICIVE